MKKRAEIINECVNAARGCWNHYNNVAISEACLVRVRAAMEEDFPPAITSDWEAYAAEYRKYVRESD